ncbi:DNA internalization-related competence protein ComEC/Rec2 [Paenalkalicoccus suaedae]|uniref:DNA internalization-related competence protein ComEC/Rec2 n=1 Tax=Paenalkalicoccus suaedae TaxID=2592382 RepID=A0A859FC63_9BACI|nr:DNA internalization-related competence protein ComEC/Rec2 [Paenalkalicoccus suaedae]QKS70839.1 DNA internalization-related competence protein ComEC/Rec2 [Paenalkalicoccus suaedae]
MGFRFFYSFIVALLTIIAMEYVLISIILGISLLISIMLKPSRSIYLAVSVFVFIFIYHEGQSPRVLLKDTPNIEGTVQSLQAMRSGDNRIEFKTKSGELVQLYTSEELEVGAWCEATVSLKEPLSRKSVYQFDEQSYLSNKGIYLTGELLESTCMNSSRFHAVHRFRNQQLQKLDELSHESIPIARALVFGDRSHMDSDYLYTFQVLGIIHLLAVSGLHVGIILAALFLILYRLGIQKERTYMIVMISIPIYIILAGAGPSILRAGSTAFFALLFAKLPIKLHGLDLLGLVGLLLLLLNPGYVYQLGFQLSFLTTGMLLLSKHELSGHSKAITVAIVSLYCQLITLPFILWHFGEISILSIPANMLLIPLVSIILLPLSFIAIIVFMWTKRTLLFDLLDVAVNIMNLIIYVFDALPSHILLTGRPDSGALFALCVSILYFFCARKKGKFVAMGAVGVIVAWMIVSPRFDSAAYVHMLDVGQGDAIFIEGPKRSHTMLIDTGGVMSWNDDYKPTGPAKKTIIPFLTYRGIQEIDTLFLTHGHVDHIGEICALLEKVTFKRAIYPLSRDIPSEAKAQLACLEERQIPITYVVSGQSFKGEYEDHTIIYSDEHAVDENDRSLVLLSTFYDTTFLFAGDTEAQGEAALEKMELEIDVIKIAHHGSKSSSTESFLDSINPALGLLTVGERNRFGHPHKEVIERYEARNIPIARTDSMGSVTVKVSESGIAVQCLHKTKKSCTY